MDTVSPAVTDAFRLLRIDLYAHLDEAEFLATKFDEWSEQDMDTARELRDSSNNRSGPRAGW